MRSRNVAVRSFSLYRLILALALSVGLGHARAQHISIDGRLSSAQTLKATNNAYTIGPLLGKQVGGNLFHSFSTFNLETGETATFDGPSAVKNIISQVTGGARSSIDGSINSAITGANLYLVNPSGISFGAHASVNISGSFHASTADYVKLADGTLVPATNQTTSTLTAAAPVAFGFLNSRPADITLNGTKITTAPTAGVGVVAGAIHLNWAGITAPSGKVYLRGVGAAGEVTLGPQSGPAPSGGPVNIVNSRIDVGDPVGRGRVGVRGSTVGLTGSTITATGGAVRVVADAAIMLDGASAIFASTSVGGMPGSVTVSTGGDLVLNGEGHGTASAISANTDNAGPAGSVHVRAANIYLLGGAAISADSNGSGNTGTVVVEAARSLTMDGQGVSTRDPQFNSRISADANRATIAPSAQTSQVNVAAQNVVLRNGAMISTFASGGGSGGAITVRVGDSLSLDAINGDAIIAGTTSAAAAGGVSVAANSISLANGAYITSDTYGTGRAGNVSISATEALLMASNSAITSVSYGEIDGAAPNTAGPAGTVSISANKMMLLPSTRISSESLLGGEGGNVVVGAGTIAMAAGSGVFTSSSGNASAGSITIVGQGAVNIDGSTAPGQLTGLFSTATGNGDAGRIGVSAGTLTLSSGGQINSSAAGNGNGGNVLLRISGQFLADGGGSDTTTGVFTGVDSRTGSGGGGFVALVAGGIALDRGASITSSTAGNGNAGGVALLSNSVISLSGGAVIGSGSGSGSGNAGHVIIDSDALLVTGSQIVAGTSGAGQAGDVTIQTGALLLTDGGSIASGTTGSGAGGKITIKSGDEIRVAESVIYTGSSSTGNAGDIILNAGSLLLDAAGRVATSANSASGGRITIQSGYLLRMRPDSAIATSVSSGFGSGGDIHIGTTYAVLDDATIRASAVGGNGGNITIDARQFIATPDSIVDASSQTAISGNITIQAPANTVTASLAQLSSRLQSLPALNRADCLGINVIEHSSSVTLGGHGSIPEDPTSFGVAHYFLGRTRSDNGISVRLQLPVPTRWSAQTVDGSACGAAALSW